MSREAVPISGGFRKRLRVALAWSFAILMFPMLVSLLYPDMSGFYLPSYSALALGVIASLLMAWIRDDANRFIAGAWLVWFFIGCLNSISSYMILGPHYRPYLEQPTIIYFAFTIAMFAGMVIIEKLCSNHIASAEPIRFEFKIIDLAILLFFCIAWGGTLVAYAGYIPILSGFDITESIYETNYGPLYGFGIVLVIAAAALFTRAMQIKRRRLGMVLGALSVLFVTSISFLDGKRYIAILIMLACCFSILRIYGGRRARGLVGALVGAAAFLYLVVFVIRQGMNVQRYDDGWLSATFIAGVEFRDFAYSVTRYEPGAIQEYSWFLSAVASMTNQTVLALMGIDKKELVNQGSAFAWAKLFNSPYGIRTGIVSELWFAYGWIGLLVMTLIGGITSRVSIAISNAKTDKQLVNRCVLLALLTSLIMGQTTSITGSMTVLLYVSIAFYLSRLLMRASGSSKRIKPV